MATESTAVARFGFLYGPWLHWLTNDYVLQATDYAVAD